MSLKQFWKIAFFGLFWAVFLWARTQKLAGDVRGQIKSQWLNTNIFLFSEGSVTTISGSHLKILMFSFLATSNAADNLHNLNWDYHQLSFSNKIVHALRLSSFKACPCTHWQVFKSSCSGVSVYFRIKSKEAEREEVYENVSTFSALSGDGHRILWSGFVLVSF